VLGTALVAPQRTHRLSCPLLNITLSRFQSLRVCTFIPSCPAQLSSIHAATLAGGADTVHPPLPAAPAPPPAAPPAPLLPAAPPVLAPAAPPLLVPAAPPLLVPAAPPDPAELPAEPAAPAAPDELPALPPLLPLPQRG